MLDASRDVRVAPSLPKLRGRTLRIAPVCLVGRRTNRRGRVLIPTCYEPDHDFCAGVYARSRD